MAWIRLFLLFFIPLISSAAHLTRRSSQGACIQASANLGDFLAVQSVIAERVAPLGFDELVVELIGANVFDQDIRQDMLCQLEGLATLSRFRAALANLDLDYAFLRIVYTMFLYELEVTKFYVVQNHNEQLAPSDREIAEIEEDLITHLEAFGLTSLDPKLAEIVNEMFAIHAENSPFFVQQLTVAEPSSLDLDDQCNLLANDLRRVWNFVIRQQQKYNPNASRDTRAILRNWTGIEITDHRDIRNKICDLLGATKTRGLEGVYDWLESEGILVSLLKRGYPELVNALGDLPHELHKTLAENSNDTPGGSDYGGDNSNRQYDRTNVLRHNVKTKRTSYSPMYYYPDVYSYFYNVTYEDDIGIDYAYYESEYQEMMMELTKYAAKLLNNVRQMGLLTLVDDL